MRVDPPPQGFKKKIVEVLRSLWHIASTDGLDKGFTTIQKKVAPVEFIFICELTLLPHPCERVDHLNSHMQVFCFS